MFSVIRAVILPWLSPLLDAALGADVVLKLLFGELGLGTGLFYKECSKPGTPLEAAHSAVEPWW